jgi:plastocyanin
VFALLLTLSACGSSSASTGATSPATTPAGAATTLAGSSANTLTITNKSFGALTVKAGATVSIVNADSVDHTVTADDGSFDVAVGAGQTASLVIPTAGTYAIHCKIHSTMHGTILVD